MKWLTEKKEIDFLLSMAESALQFYAH